MAGRVDIQVDFGKVWRDQFYLFGHDECGVGVCLFVVVVDVCMGKDWMR